MCTVDSRSVKRITSDEKEEELEETEENSTTSAALEMLANVPSTSFVPLAGNGMDDELEEDVSSLDEIGRLLDSRKTSTFFHIAQNCFLITMKHDIAWRGKSSKKTSDSSCR